MGASQVKIDKLKRAKEVLMKEPWIDVQAIVSRFGISRSSASELLKKVREELHIEKPKSTEYIGTGEEHPWRRKARILGNRAKHDS